MGGSTKNNKNVLQSWYKLFKNKYKLFSNDKLDKIWDNIEKIGLPNDMHEDWKYTSLDKFYLHEFTLPLQNNYNLNIIYDYISLYRDTTYLLIFIDGILYYKFNDINTGCEIKTLNNNLNNNYDISVIKKDVFSYLTDIFSKDIIYINLKNNKLSNKPIYILHISEGNNDTNKLNILSNIINIKIEKETKGSIIEHYISLNNNGYFINSKLNIYIEENSQLNYEKVFCENINSYHFAKNNFYIKNNSNINSNFFILGSGKITHNYTNVILSEKNSNIYINSLSIPDIECTADNKTYVKHKNSNCVSEQIHKMIAIHNTNCIFQGLINVSKCAHDTNGQMISRNLLLDSSSVINIKPQLEIYSDNVHCCHGATISDIDETMIFYFQSRGITWNIAKELLIYAFSNEITKKINNKIIYDIVKNKIKLIIQEKQNNDLLLSNRKN